MDTGTAKDICFHFDWLGFGPCPRCGERVTSYERERAKPANDLTEGLSSLSSAPIRVAPGETVTVRLDTPLLLSGPYRIGIATQGVGTVRVTEIRMGNQVITLGLFGGGEMPVEHLELSDDPDDDDKRAWPRGLVPVRGPAWPPGVWTLIRVRNVSSMTEEINVTIWARQPPDVAAASNETNAHLVDLAAQIRDWRKKHAHLSDRIAELNRLLEASEKARLAAESRLDAHDASTRDGHRETLSHEIFAKRRLVAAEQGVSSEPRLGWFGKRWDSPLCDTRPACKMPPGECFGCGCIFRGDDSGVTIMDRAESVPFHKRCFPKWMRSKQLPLDMRVVADAAIDTRDNAERSAYEADRVASRAREISLVRGYEPGEVWESPSWDE